MPRPIYKIACCSCDNMADEVRAIPQGWRDVERVQTLREARREGEPDTPWWTHLGYCPECKDG